MTPEPAAGWLEVRGNLLRVLARLRETPRTIAYFGASVTAQRSGYRPRLAAALQAATGHEHRSVNAGIGGVGSISGLFLMDRLVLAHRPDVCLVEFSLADRLGWTPPELLGPALEAIVWKLRSQGCEPCFVHLFRGDGADNGALSTYRRIARRHAVSEVDVSARLADGIESGRWTVDELLSDVVHTTPRGSEVVAETLLRALMNEGSDGPSDASPAPPLYRSRFHGAHVVPTRVEHLQRPGHHRQGRFRFSYDYLALGTENRLECQFNGELVGLVIIVGPHAGVIRVQSQGRSAEMTTWDAACHYERLSTAVFDRPWPAGAAVTIEPTDIPVVAASPEGPVPPPDAPKQLKLVGFMVGS